MRTILYQTLEYRHRTVRFAARVGEGIRRISRRVVVFFREVAGAHIITLIDVISRGSERGGLLRFYFALADGFDDRQLLLLGIICDGQALVRLYIEQAARRGINVKTSLIIESYRGYSVRWHELKAGK